VDNHPVVQVESDPLEVLEFIKRGLGPMNAMCDRAQMFEHLGVPYELEQTHASLRNYDHLLNRLNYFWVKLPKRVGATELRIVR
jgi:hypothetical protein